MPIKVGDFLRQSARAYEESIINLQCSAMQCMYVTDACHTYKASNAIKRVGSERGHISTPGIGYSSTPPNRVALGTLLKIWNRELRFPCQDTWVK